MKKLNAVLTILMLSAGAFSACSGNSDSLARADKETQAQWGLTFYENKAETKSESEAITENETKEEEESFSEETNKEEIKETEKETKEESQAEASDDDTAENLAWSTIDVNVRKGPGASYDSVGILKQNQSVKVLDSSDTWWWKVEFNGQEAYISVPYLTTDQPE